jgi:hypothetical protein
MLFKLHEDIEVVSKFIERNTIRHEKLGYVCRMSIFGSNEHLVTEENIDDHDNTVLLIGNNDEKMERSTQNFLAYYKETSNNTELREGFNITSSEIQRRIKQTEIT